MAPFLSQASPLNEPYVKDRILSQLLKGEITEREAIEAWNQCKRESLSFEVIELRIEGGTISLEL